ncbi:MAG: hypothetical protein AAFU85_23195 [Planctomycetota bacterium]
MFAKSLNAFDTLQNHVPFKTFDGWGKDAIADRDTASTLRLLTHHQETSFVLSDHMLRTLGENNGVVEAFYVVAAKVSTPVRFQMWYHLHTRSDYSVER